jgi:protein ImuB
VTVTVATEFSPRVQRYGHDCVVLDISGLGRLLGDPQAIGGEIASRIAHLVHGTRITDPHGTPIPRIGDSHGMRVARVAVAPTQAGALLLSSAFPGLTVVTDDVASALAPVRLDVLRHVCAEIIGAAMASMSGTDPRESASRKTDQQSAKSAFRKTDPRSAHEKAFAILDRWGLTTLGEVAALPAEAFSARLGQTGIALQRLSRGVDAGPLVPDPEVPRLLERIELEWPIDGLEPLAFVLARLLEPLALVLERADRAAAAIHLRLRLVDRTAHVRLLQLPAAIRDPKVLRTLLILDLESHPPPAAIDVVAIEIDPAPGRVLQYSLLERARPSAETLATLTARLGALVGESRVGQAVLRDSHGPDAFEMRRFAPDERGGSTARASEAAPRPLLEQAVLRRFRPPIAVRVTVDRGRPAYLFIDRRGMPGGAIEQCAGPWRTSGAWWLVQGKGPWNRDEWDVALSDGSVCRLFQARDTESVQWFLDGVVD